MNEEVQFRRPELMPLSILRAIWKRKLAILAIFLVLTIVSVAVVVLIPPEYSASALILIEQQRIPERFVTPTVNEGIESRLNRINNQAQAYDVLERIIQEFNLYPDERAEMAEEEVIENMRDHISVAPVAGLTANRGNTTAFRVSFRDARPDHVAQVANRLANTFVDENKRSRTIAAEGTASFIDTQIQDAQNSLNRAEERLTQIRQQYMGELPEQEGAVVAEISRRQVEYQAAEAEVARTHQAKMFLENNLEAAIAALEIAQRGVNEQADSQTDEAGAGQAPASLRAQLAQATANAEALKARYSETHPDVLRAQSYVAELVASLETAEAEARKASEQPLESSATISPEDAGILLQAETRVKQLRTQLTVADQTIKNAEARRASASAAFGAASAKMGRIPIHQQDLVGAQREYDTALARWMELSNKSFDANLAQTMEERESSERLTVIDFARVPSKPVWPPREAFAGGAALGSLVLACIFGFVLELKKNVVLGEWEMPADVPVLGRIPIIVPDDDLAGSNLVHSGGLGLRKRTLLASSVLLSLAAMAVATSLYFGWISF
jgi:polysaccharide chain length determinant protein (PEP-CTERM system associated)